MDLELSIRLAAFKWLEGQKARYADVLPWDILQKGFDFKGARVPLVSVQGIFKPKILQYPLSIRTAFEGPYPDLMDKKSQFLSYKYRGTDAGHPENIGLRVAMEKQLPLIYFRATKKGQYVATFPVYVIKDAPGELSFQILVDSVDSLRDSKPDLKVAESRREYITAEVKVRLHQQIFRERVLDAYNTQCTFCRLRHKELLEAAHIIPDSEPESKPIVENGLSLCKLHHAAYDNYFVGVTPDYKISVRQDLLNETDGPMLQYGIKELNGNKIILPRNEKYFPKQEYLEWRFEKFKDAV